MRWQSWKSWVWEPKPTLLQLSYEQNTRSTYRPFCPRPKKLPIGREIQIKSTVYMVKRLAWTREGGYPKVNENRFAKNRPGNEIVVPTFNVRGLLAAQKFFKEIVDLIL